MFVAGVALLQVMETCPVYVGLAGVLGAKFFTPALTDAVKVKGVCPDALSTASQFASLLTVTVHVVAALAPNTEMSEGSGRAESPCR